MALENCGPHEWKRSGPLENRSQVTIDCRQGDLMGESGLVGWARVRMAETAGYPKDIASLERSQWASTTIRHL